MDDRPSCAGTRLWNRVVSRGRSIRRRVLYGRLPAVILSDADIPKQTVPPGIEWVYQVAQEKLADQLASIDQLDTKAGVIIGALVAASGATISLGHLESSVRDALVAIALLAIVLAGRAFVVQKYEDTPDPAALVAYASLSANEIKTLILQDLVDARVENEQKRILKGRLINASLYIAGIGVAVALLSKVF